MSLPELTISLTAEQIAVILGFSIGYLWGEAFSGFDKMFKHSENGEYSEMEKWKKFVVGALLDANHHFQYGLMLMLAAMKQTDFWILRFSWFKTHPTITLIILWMGWGLVVSDGKDYRNILRRLGFTVDNEEPGVDG